MMMKNDPESDDTRSRPPTGRAPTGSRLLGTVFTWPLLFVGGLVTTYRVGMAVPDWPTTFGMNMFLYDMTRASWAVFGEHTHRLYGAAVGVFVILLMVDLFAFDRRPWMRWLGVAGAGRGDRPGGPGRLSGPAQLDAPGGDPRDLGAGLLRPDGRPLRADRPGLVPAVEAVPRPASSAGSRRRCSAWSTSRSRSGPGSGTTARSTPWPSTRSSPSRSSGMARRWSPGSSGTGDRLPELVPAARAMAVLLALQICSGSVHGGSSGRMMGSPGR